MSVKTYDNGAFYSVSFGEAEVADFRRQWPASGLSALRSIWAQYDRRNGDLVDLRCNGRGSCDRFDGPALKALTDDMQCAATKRAAKARAPKGHCRNPQEPVWKYHHGMSGAKKTKAKRKSSCGCGG